MSITVVKQAFTTGLAGKAACTSATMSYEQGGRIQRLRFTLAGGEVREVTAEPQDDLAMVARQLGEQIAAEKG